MIEKRYRTNINDKILILRDCVPSLKCLVEGKDENADLDGLSAATKLNKGTILTKATEYIKHLQKKNEELIKENEKLKADKTGSKKEMVDIDVDMDSKKIKIKSESPQPQPITPRSDSSPSESISSPESSTTNTSLLSPRAHQDSSSKLVMTAMAGIVATGLINDLDSAASDRSSLSSIPTPIVMTISEMMGLKTLFWAFRLTLLMVTVFNILSPDNKNKKYNKFKKNRKIHHATTNNTTNDSDNNDTTNSLKGKGISIHDLRIKIWKITTRNDLFLSSRNDTDVGYYDDNKSTSIFNAIIPFCLLILKLSMIFIIGRENFQSLLYYTDSLTSFVTSSSTTSSVHENNTDNNKNKKFKNQDAQYVLISRSIDSQLTGGDSKVSLSRLIYTFLMGFLLPSSPIRLMTSAIHSKLICECYFSNSKILNKTWKKFWFSISIKCWIYARQMIQEYEFDLSSQNKKIDYSNITDIDSFQLSKHLRDLLIESDEFEFFNNDIIWIKMLQLIFISNNIENYPLILLNHNINSNNRNNNNTSNNKQLSFLIESDDVINNFDLKSPLDILSIWYSKYLLNSILEKIIIYDQNHMINKLNYDENSSDFDFDYDFDIDYLNSKIMIKNDIDYELNIKIQDMIKDSFMIIPKICTDMVLQCYFIKCLFKDNLEKTNLIDLVNFIKTNVLTNNKIHDNNINNNNFDNDDKGFENSLNLNQQISLYSCFTIYYLKNSNFKMMFYYLKKLNLLKKSIYNQLNYFENNNFNKINNDLIQIKNNTQKNIIINDINDEPEIFDLISFCGLITIIRKIEKLSNLGKIQIHNNENDNITLNNSESESDDEPKTPLSSSQCYNCDDDFQYDFQFQDEENLANYIETIAGICRIWVGSDNKRIKNCGLEMSTRREISDWCVKMGCWFGGVDFIDEGYASY